MNVNPTNAAGNAFYIQPADDDMSDRVKELEELCEQQKAQLDQQRQEIEMLRAKVSFFEAEWSKIQEAIEKGKEIYDQANDYLNSRYNFDVDDLPEDLF